MSEEMTREQAIEYFRNKTAFVDGKEKQACEIAILAIAALSAEPKLRQALEQEKGAYNALVKNVHCEDAISRAEAQTEIMMFAGNCKSDEEDIYIKVSDAVQLLRNLPSVHAKPRTGQSKSIPSGLKLKIEREADYQNERVNADIARGMYLALEIIDKWEADHA